MHLSDSYTGIIQTATTNIKNNVKKHPKMKANKVEKICSQKVNTVIIYRNIIIQKKISL